MLETKVYFHCRFLICKKSSATDECTQKCTKDGNKRRALEEGGIEEVYVNSRKSLLLVGGGVAKTLCPFLKTHNIFKEKQGFLRTSVFGIVCPFFTASIILSVFQSEQEF